MGVADLQMTDGSANGPESHGWRALPRSTPAIGAGARDGKGAPSVRRQERPSPLRTPARPLARRLPPEPGRPTRV
jgi:hypothetical protein